MKPKPVRSLLGLKTYSSAMNWRVTMDTHPPSISGSPPDRRRDKTLLRLFFVYQSVADSCIFLPRSVLYLTVRNEMTPKGGCARLNAAS